MPERRATPPVSKAPKPFANWDAVIPRDRVGGQEVIRGVMAFLGDRRQGKSALAHWLADGLHERYGLPVLAWGIPKAAQQYFPDYYIHDSGDVEKMRKYRGHIVLADEMVVRANARRTMSDENVGYGKTVAISGQARQLLLFIFQHTRQVDFNIVGYANRIVFKLPTILHIRFARPELRPEVQKAREILLAKRNPRIWSYTVDYSSGRAGVLQNGLAPWWTENSSESYSLAEAGELETPSQRSQKSRGYAAIRRVV